MAVYGTSVSYFWWQMVYLGVPGLMKWEGALVGTYLVVGVIILGLLSAAGVLLAFPLAQLSAPVYFYLLPLLASVMGCLGAVCLPWKFLRSLEVLHIITAFILDSFILALYGSFIFALIKDGPFRFFFSGWLTKRGKA